MKVFQLILFSLQEPYELQFKAQLQRYLVSFQSRWRGKFDFAFYCFDPSISVPQFDAEDHLLRIPGTEEFQIGILQKTIQAIRWALAKEEDIDFLVRSNISTFLHWPLLYHLLETQQRPAWTYTGPYYHPKSYIDLRAGFTPAKIRQYGPVPFVSGTCIVLSKQTARFLVASEAILIGEIAVVDDLAIGILMNSPFYHGWRLQCGAFSPSQRHDIPMDSQNRYFRINDATCHPNVIVAYRNKRDSKDRSSDVRAMQRLVDFHINLT